jgi:3D (Asp-Asp-Asp) domain-containing protein
MDKRFSPKVLAVSLAVATFAATFLGGCASTNSDWRMARKGDIVNLRTTAYTHSEADHLKYGRKNAIGTTLRTGKITSAASDWSRIPLGTRFKVLSTGRVYEIDDYGSALVGTNTVDLYKPNRREMNRWGARWEKIKILKIGSYRRSREVMDARQRHRHVAEMVAVIDRRNGRKPGDMAEKTRGSTDRDH